MNERKPYALHVASWYPVHDKPFAGDFIQRHIQAIADKFPSCVLHVHRIAQVPDSNWQVVSQGNFTEYIKYFSCRFRLLVPLFYALYYLQGCKKICKQHGHPALLHVHVLNRIAIVALWLWRRLRVPLFVTEHWTGYHDERFAHLSKLQQSAMRKLTSGAQWILPVTQHLQRAMAQHGLIGNYAVVPNVVDVDQFQPQPQPLAQDTFRWLHISNLRDGHKNVSGILRVFARFVTAHPGHELHIVHSHRNVSLEQYADELGLTEGQVKFHGALSHDELAPFVASCRALLLFSHFENFPCVLPEAWAAGIPAVSSAVGGIPEYFSEEQGELCDPGDEVSLFAAMERLYNRYHEFDKVALHNYANEHFSREAVGGRVVALYREYTNT